MKDKNYPGLAMSRSIGDRVAHVVGVTCIPDVTIYKMNTKVYDYVLLNATDGIWDAIDISKIKSFL